VSSDPHATEAELRHAGFKPADSEDRWLEVDRREPWTMPTGATVALATDIPGTSGFADLHRYAGIVEIDDRTAIAAAHPRDLLRLGDASPRETERTRLPGLRALLSQRGNVKQ
jgi:hypothetical protein